MDDEIFMQNSKVCPYCKIRKYNSEFYECRGRRERRCKECAKIQKRGKERTAVLKSKYDHPWRSKAYGKF